MIAGSFGAYPVETTRDHGFIPETSRLPGCLGAARRHYELAVEALARADQAWLGRLISQRVPLSGWPQALTRQPGDVKVVVDLTR